MNLLSEPRAPLDTRNLPSGTPSVTLLPPTASENQNRESSFAPLEYRSLAEDEVETMPGTAIEGDESTDSAAGGSMDGRGASTGRQPSGWEQSARDLADAARREGVAAGEREGRRVVHAQMEAEMQASVARERQLLLAAVAEFAAARDRYFSDIEQEVVRLALAIAARVLHRETQMDPLLLAAAVRVALEKMADRSGVVLRASATEVAAWERMFQATEPADRPRVVADERLQPGECVLETKLGTVELGVRAQLEEIERGFFDLLNHRPAQVSQRPPR